jgi:parallel beta-helix repeat protein
VKNGVNFVNFKKTITDKLNNFFKFMLKRNFKNLIFLLLNFALIINLGAAINDYNRNGGVYYGWPISVNGSSTVAQAVAHYSNWQFIVFGEDCATNSAVRANLRAIMSNLHRPGYKTKCFGYVAIGSNSGNNWRTLTTVTNLMKAWYNNYSPYIDGFFLDEFSYDWGATRYRQNVAVDKAHNWGKKVLANGWFPDHCMGLTDDPSYPNSIYNPSLQPSHLTTNDYYVWENWVWSTTNGSSPATWNNKDQWKSKTLKVMEYQYTKGIKTLAISVERANYNQFGSPTSRTHEDFAFWCVLGAGFTNFQFSEYNFSSGNNRLYFYTNLKFIATNVGSYYTSDYLQEVTNGIFYRYTDTGVIRLNWNTHTGSFIPLPADTTKPQFLTNDFIPKNGESGVSFNCTIYIEVIDNRGVLRKSINCQINGTNAITNGVFLPLYNGPESQIVDNGRGGFFIFIDRTNNYGINKQVDVKIWCSDGYNNKATNIFSFTTGSTNTCISIDGNLSDWPGYSEWNLDTKYDMTNEKYANILRNYFFDNVDKAKVTNLYIAFIQQGSLNTSFVVGHQVYIDKDNNSSTGNTTDVWWQKFGAEYYFEFFTKNNKLEYCEGVKKWTNGSWVNTGVIPSFGVSSNKIEIAVPFSKLRITNSTIGIAVASYSTNWTDLDGNNGKDENKYVYRMKRKICPDTSKPVFLTNNFDPKPNETDVSFRANIYIEIIDDGKVRSNSINVQVNGTNAIVNGAFQPLYKGSESSIIYNGLGGYNITIDRTNLFKPYSTITVKVWATDMYGNSATNIYYFTTGGTNQCISPDGDLSDWPGFAMMYSDPNSDAPVGSIDIIKNYIFDGVGANGVTNIYLAFKFRTNASSDSRVYEHLIYIDSDRNSGTGNISEPYWVSPVMGADYKIDFYTKAGSINYVENIMRWNGSSWVDTGYKPFIGGSGNAVELVIPKNRIGNPSSSFDITFCSVFTNYIDYDSNNDENQPAITYNFYRGFCVDKEPPTFATNNFYPQNGEENVPFSASLYIEIDDNGGVASNKINVKINGTPAIVNGVFQSGFNGPESKIYSDGGTGLNILIDPVSDFTRNQYISVEVIAGDFQNNYATNTYYFITGSTNVCITIDGDLSDFGGYSKVKMDYKGDNLAPVDIIRVFYFDGSTPAYITNLYFGFKFAASQNTGEEYVTGIYIDADNNSSTGNPSMPWFITPSMGADYYIEIYTLNNIVAYRGIYSNSSGSWVNMNAGASIQAAINNDVLEVAVPRSLLSKVSGYTLRFAFYANTTNWTSEDEVPDKNNPAIKYRLQNKHCIDTVPPYLADSFPKNGALGMSPDWDVKVWLNDNSMIISNSILIRIDEGGSGANVKTAFSNGQFRTTYATGSISKWNNGWYLLINPNNNFPKSSLIIVYVFCKDQDNNICNTNFSFTTAYTTYNPPPPPPPGITKPFKQAAVYYGWPTFSEGGKEEWDNPELDPPYKIEQCANVWNDYYFIVLGYSLATTEYHTTQWTQTRNIINTLRSSPSNKTKIFGYIPLGCTLNLTLSQITNRFNRWREFNVDGIFWDEFGYDYGASCSLQNNYRARQNAVLDLTHQYGLTAIINGWYFDHCFTTNNDPNYPNSTYNPSRLPDHAQAGDIFCNESFLYANGSYLSGANLTFQIQKAYKCLDLEKTRGIKTFTISTMPSGYQWGQFDTAASIKAQIYTFYAMLLFGFDYYQFTDINYSATVGDNYLYYLPDWDGATGFPSNWFPYIGTMYTSDVRTNSVSPLILERCTDYGRIWVNFTSYTGGFNKFTTYYVNSDPAIGNNGYTPSQAQNEVTPWRTIGHAISNASPGDIIKVKGSTTYPYQESVIIPVSGGGFCFDYIQIIGYGDQPVILDGQNTRSIGIKFTNNSSRIKIQNIEIKNYTDAGIYISNCGSSNIIIKDCKIHHNLNYGIRIKGTKHTIENNTIWSNGDGGANDAGIYIDSDCSDDSLVHNNQIYQNRGYGIYINGGDNNEIANNKIYNNTSHGIYASNNADNTAVSLNTTYKNNGAGIYIAGSTGTKVQNNTSVKNQYGYYFTSSATIKNNISYSNSNTGYYSTVANTVTYSIASKDASLANANINGGNFLSGTGCRTNNPLFSNSAIDDYRLSYNSPAINTGSPTTERAAIGGTVTSIKLSTAIPGRYAKNTNTFTIYANKPIPADAQICFSYPPGFDISGATLVSKSFDGGAYVSIYLNEIAIIRDGKGTAIPGGTSIKVVLTNIRNTAIPGGQTVQWYIKNANGEIIMGPQQSNDIFILEPFAIIARTPAPGATNVAYNATVDVYFSQNVNTSTLNTNTFYVTDDTGKKVAGTFTMISSNAVRFTPSIALPPNGFVTVTVTTDLEATTTQTLVSNNYWSFRVGPGPTTPHYYHTITLDGNLSEWDPVYNYLTYDSSLTERVGRDTSDTCVMDTTNFYVTWDSNYIYFGIKKNNNANINNLFRDLIAIDITKDNIGASSFDDSSEGSTTRSFVTPSFSGNRKPEFIINMTYNWSGNRWNNGVCWKWNDTTKSWVKNIFSVTWGFNNSVALEVRMPISALTNRSVGVSSGIPNRIAVLHFVSYAPGCGNVAANNPPQDYCPDNGSWVNVDIDNDGNDIPDKLPPMSITYQYPTPNGQCNVNDNISIGFSDPINASTVNTNNIWVEYNGQKIPGTFIVVGTNIIFDPSSPLLGGETYTIVVTLNVRSTSGKSLASVATWKFIPQPAPETPHIYNTINCDHNKSDWNPNNVVTWNSTLTEKVASDGSDTESTATTNLWVTWDATKIYFRLDKSCASNTSSILWQDFIAIDVSRDENGAGSFTCTNATGGTPNYTFTFTGNEKPDFIISLRHDQWQAYYASAELRKWTGTGWSQPATINVHFGYQGTIPNSSDFVECWILASYLTNSAVGVNSGIPNRIKIKSMMHNNSQNVQDYCPEDGSWREIHIDNNGDDILDKLRALEVISSDPTNYAKNVPFNKNILLTFNYAISNETVRSNTLYIFDSDWNKVALSYNISGSNITLTHSANFKPNEFYTIVITTNVYGKTGKKPISTIYRYFYTSPSWETVHTKHAITLNANLSDWDVNNNVTYDNSKTEFVARDVGDEANAAVTTNLYLNWDNTYLYFAIVKNNAGNVNSPGWYDFLAIDISRDNLGGSSFKSNSTSIYFGKYRLPDFILYNNHVGSYYYWNRGEGYYPLLYKWTGSSWQRVGTLGVDYDIQTTTYNNSKFLEGWIRISSLTNRKVRPSGDVPNRISILHWVDESSSVGVNDYCPEFATSSNAPGTNWVTIDLDNNDDNIPDGATPALHLLSIKPLNQSSNISLTTKITAVFDMNINNTTVSTSTFYLLDSDNNKVSGSFNVTSKTVSFTPSQSLKPNEFYRIIITTNVYSTTVVNMDAPVTNYFYTAPGSATFHYYHSIYLNAQMNEWSINNNITYNTTYNERIARDATETGGPEASTNLWITWNTNKLFFMIVKNNNGSSTADWVDYIAFDITRDFKGATNYSDSFTGNVKFLNYRKPEYILEIRHNLASSTYNWEYTNVYFKKYTGSSWSNIGVRGVDFSIQSNSYNNSKVLEGFIKFSLLDKFTRVSVIHWAGYSGSVLDYTPEMPNSQTASNKYWRTFDSDNNYDTIPDGIPLYLHIISTYPTNRAKAISRSTNIKIKFDDLIDNSSISTSTVYLQDSDFNKVPGTFNISGSNLTFSPSTSLKPNEFYTVTVTTFVLGSMGQYLASNYIFHFYTTNGSATSHNYNSIILDADESDWDNSNNVTYDNTKTENIASDSATEDGILAHATTNLKITWDSSKLYFALLKKNAGTSSADWYDFIAFDVTRDDYGAERFTNSLYCGTVHFMKNRMPEYILQIDHTEIAYKWDRDGSETYLYKYNGTNFVQIGTIGIDYDIQPESYNTSRIVEGYIDLSIFKDRDNKLPNRVAVMNFAALRTAGTVYDFCPEFKAPGTSHTWATNKYWVTFDIDNDNNEIPDGTAGGTSLSIVKYISNIKLNGNSTALIPGSTIEYVIKYSNIGTTAANDVVIYDKIDINYLVFKTNLQGSASGWTFQISTNLTPNQSYDSTDYSDVIPSDKTKIKWIRWKKASVGTDEDGLTLKFSVILK